MKCPNCSAEWYLPEQIHTNLSMCPFCGTSLQCGSSKAFSTMDDVLCEIIRRFGIVMSDVETDLATIADKYEKQYVGLHNILQNKSAQTQAGLTGILRKKIGG